MEKDIPFDPDNGIDEDVRGLLVTHVETTYEQK